MGVVAVGEGHAQRGHACQAGRDAVDDSHGNALRLQVLHFLAAASKDERVTAFESHHCFASQRFLHHEFFNEGLWRGLATSALAHMDDACDGRRMGRDGVTHQVVDQQYCGGCDRFDGFERQQLGVARACADQRDMGLLRISWQGVCHGQRLKAFRVACTCAAKGAGTGNSPLSTACV